MKAEAKHDTARLNLNARQSLLNAHMKWALAAVALMSVLATTPAAATGSKDPGLKVFGLTADQELVKFRSNRPRLHRVIGVVSPLQGSDAGLVGIDFRVQDGLLYGVGNAGGIYTIDTRTAAPTLVSQLSVPLDVNATFFGVDFNPAADRLRIISDTGQNLRHNLSTNVTSLDDALDYPPPGPPFNQVGPNATGVTGAAYTNNDLNQPSTGTTLFDIDTATIPPATDPQDQVVIQSPPNNGSLVATGQLGFDADQDAGFDIYSRLNHSGVTVQNHAFASLLVNGNYGFYRIELTTGKPTFLGNFYEPVVDIAVRLNQ